MIAAAPMTYVGVQALALSGVHQDIAGTQHGFAGGGFVELQVGNRRVRLHIEGVPVVSVPQHATAHYGQATPAVGIVDGALRFGFGAEGRLFAGIGDDVINQHTPLPNLDKEVASRLSGVRYELGYREPLSGTHFLEGLVAVVPSLWGRDIYTYSVPHAPLDEDELASETDYSVAYGWQAGGSEWLVGVRSINFAAHFTATGAPADCNRGFGMLAEWRAVLTH